MSSLDSPDYSHDHLSQELVLEMESRKRKILDDIAGLLESGGIEDAVDQGIVQDTIEFIENPSEVLEEIMPVTALFANVIAGYMMEGADVPPKIDAVNAYLFGLQCISKIKFIELELTKEDFDPLTIQEAMIWGSDWAKSISKQYDDNTFINAFNELQESIENL